jgi:exonuclease SbcC
VESLFIDEGFGTLDKERLNLVSETLKKVKREVNKTIGIITHIEELANQFDKKIEIIPRPEGSIIKVG